MANLQPQLNIWEANPKLKMLLLILIFVFLGSGIGLVVFAQWSNSYRQQVYEQTQAGLPVHQVKQATTTSESLANNQVTIAGWKTYRDDQYGFQFQYPANLAFDISTTRDFGLIITNSGRSWDDYVKNARSYDLETGDGDTFNSIVVGGFHAISIHSPNQTTTANEVQFMKDQKLYDFVFIKVSQETANKILSTFKFIK